MTTLEKFLSYLEEQVKNHSMYVWGAQGQKGPEITEEWIRKREPSAINAARAVAFWKKQVKAGYGDKLRAFDCSGLGVCFFLQNGLLKKDTTADGLLKLCTRILEKELSPGDFVFKTYASGKAYHIGYVVDDKLNVIEAKGRDAGVVKGSLKGWNMYGRPPFWCKAKSRVLTLTNSYMKGDDVLALQKALAGKGYAADSLDGIFGHATDRVLRAFQAGAGLAADGKAGPLTFQALGLTWYS